MDKYTETYKEEAGELLVELETALMALEEKPDDKEIIGRVFRAMHTIKGSGAMFGFDDIAAFSHEIESVYDLVRSEVIPVTKELIDKSLIACDLIQKMVNGEYVDDDKMLTTISSFSKMLSAFSDTESAPSFFPPENEPLEIEKTPYHIYFKPEPDIFQTGANPILLIEELDAMGEAQVRMHADDIPLLDKLEPEKCYIGWTVYLTTTESINALKDVFIFVEDRCELIIEVDESGETEAAVHVENEKPPPDKVDIKFIASPPGFWSETKEEETEAEIKQKKFDKDIAQSSSVRVAAEKLDILVNLVGELVTVQARLSQKAWSYNDPELISVSEEVERLTADLRENTMSIRMLPIGTTFTRFKRLVRDLSTELRKEVRLITQGGETELDKTVIEHLNEPLIHIIRNIIDHGIESPEERVAAGKPAYGTVRISAEHSGANVFIRISGDGRGLDAEAIRLKAINKGLISPEALLTEKDIYSLIFLPGFSTAKRITDVSGRGVGLDVVKKSIEALGGDIEMNSVKGKGTTTTLKLPLTLAIIDGLLVKLERDYYVAPLSVVEECIELSRVDAEKAFKRNMLTFRNEIVPYISLRKHFAMEGAPPDIEQVVIVESKDGRVGIGVDHVIGQHQTVIKTLGKAYKDIDGISGATILGDGTVALILDIMRLVASVENLIRSGANKAKEAGV